MDGGKKTQLVVGKYMLEKMVKNNPFSITYDAVDLQTKSIPYEAKIANKRDAPLYAKMLEYECKIRKELYKAGKMALIQNTYASFTALASTETFTTSSLTDQDRV